MENREYVLIVPIKVKNEYIHQFALAASENARESRKEKGVIRFEVFKNMQDPTLFTFVEVFYSQQDHQSHRETAHYKKFRDLVPTMVAEAYTAYPCEFVDIQE